MEDMTSYIFRMGQTVHLFHFFFFSVVVFGSPFSDTYPSFIWKSLKKSRKDKDIFNPFFQFLNKTKIYDHILKYNTRYWMFALMGGTVTSYFWGIWFNKKWKEVNKGKLYIDCPYKYPEED